MARPYWSGQLRISLVSFGIRLFPATESKSEIHFHQLNRKTGERIKYQKTTSDQDPVEASNIVKGYEYRKGEYVTVEPEDLEHLRIPSRNTLEITQCIAIDEIDPEYFEKPYFVLPESDTHAEAFAVVRKALQTARKAAVGKIAFGGREHLVAIAASSTDTHPGMMAYTLRYAEELRKPSAYFSEIKKVAIDKDQLALAKELLDRKTAAFSPEQFKDEYEAALRTMIEAKLKHTPQPKAERAPRSAKVINLMDALRRSVQENEHPPAKRAAFSSHTEKHKKGPILVKMPRTTKSRKSA